MEAIMVDRTAAAAACLLTPFPTGRQLTQSS
jgi:hypothetical protein